MNKIKRLKKTEALKMIEDLERKRLESLTKEQLLERVLSGMMSYVEDYDNAMISNRLLALSDGKFGLDY